MTTAQDIYNELYKALVDPKVQDPSTIYYEDQEWIPKRMRSLKDLDKDLYCKIHKVFLEGFKVKEEFEGKTIELTPTFNEDYQDINITYPNGCGTSYNMVRFYGRFVAAPAYYSKKK